MDEEYSRRKFLSYLLATGGGLLSGCVEGNEPPQVDSAGKKSEGSGSLIPSISALVPQKEWEFNTQGEVISSPAVVDGVLYCGSHDGYMYALEGDNSESGGGDYSMFKYDLANTSAPDTRGPQGDVSEKWRFPTDGRVVPAPAVVDGNVYFGSEDNYFYSVSTDTGEENWRFDTGGIVGKGSPTVRGGVVYFSSGCSGDMYCSNSEDSGDLYALDADTGKEIWSVDVEIGGQCPPAVTEERVFFGARDSKFYSLDSDTGEEIWSFEGDDHFCASGPAVKDGIVYVGSEDGSLYALSTQNGDLVWEFETTDVVISSPAVAEGKVYFGSGDTNIYGVDAETGEEVWRVPTDGQVFCSPAYRDGIVYAGSRDWKMYAIDAGTGEEVWEYETGGVVWSAPVAAENGIYFGSRGGNIHAVRNKVVEDIEAEQ